MYQLYSDFFSLIQRFLSGSQAIAKVVALQRLLEHVENEEGGRCDGPGGRDRVVGETDQTTRAAWFERRCYLVSKREVAGFVSKREVAAVSKAETRHGVH